MRSFENFATSDSNSKMKSIIAVTLAQCLFALTVVSAHQRYVAHMVCTTKALQTMDLELASNAPKPTHPSPAFQDHQILGINFTRFGRFKPSCYLGGNIRPIGPSYNYVIWYKTSDMGSQKILRFHRDEKLKEFTHYVDNVFIYTTYLYGPGPFETMKEFLPRVRKLLDIHIKTDQAQIVNKMFKKMSAQFSKMSLMSSSVDVNEKGSYAMFT